MSRNLTQEEIDAALEVAAAKIDEIDALALEAHASRLCHAGLSHDQIMDKLRVIATEAYENRQRILCDLHGQLKTWKADAQLH